MSYERAYKITKFLLGLSAVSSTHLLTFLDPHESLTSTVVEMSLEGISYHSLNTASVSQQIAWGRSVAS